jgi:hypothetical protein
MCNCIYHSFLNHTKSLQLRFPDVGKAEGNLSKNSLKSAYSIEQLIERQSVERSLRETLRTFYFSNRAKRQSRAQELQTSQVYDMIAAKERDWVAGVSQKPRAIPVMVIGIAGTGVGSIIKRHARRGGKQLRRRHRRYTPVVMTDEYKTSQTCIACFGKLVRPNISKMIKGELKPHRCNGSSICFNPQCPSYKSGVNTQNRDTEASVCISIAGVSQMYTKNRLPPFTR